MNKRFSARFKDHFRHPPVEAHAPRQDAHGAKPGCMGRSNARIRVVEVRRQVTGVAHQE